MKKYFLVILLTALAGGFLGAQSNAVIDEILDQDEVHLSHAAYLLATAGDLLEDSAQPQDALSYMQDAGWVDRGANPQDMVTAELFSYLLMRTLNIRGGIMYSLFPGPRYAYREMVFQSILDSSVGRKDSLSGDQVLRYLATAMENQGGQS
ncbi:hypothetical protein [Spirochaeta lutea]|uniref:SLH domain-containing protein n=1 Tax=Spirochaeta lutea TaxID=1480694 RepID=A0A098QSU8_9SPIO|nr:hypothetical protein [Spirochaeta lutea]KGE70930.1 hypothetical protein DC28_13385 [Spirochaeta lutea]